MNIPLFPLDTVIFPGGNLHLRIYEPRYFRMVSECMRNDSGFGICLIANKVNKKSRKTKKTAMREKVLSLHSMGTYVRIIDWKQLEHGMLGIQVQADNRFRLHTVVELKSHLVIGEVDYLDEHTQELSQAHVGFAELLQEIVERFKLDLPQQPDCYQEAGWVSSRLAEILPFDANAKQRMLEMDDPSSRFDYMQGLLESIELNNKHLQ